MEMEMEKNRVREKERKGGRERGRDIMNKM